MVSYKMKVDTATGHHYSFSVHLYPRFYCDGHLRTIPKIKPRQLTHMSHDGPVYLFLRAVLMSRTTSTRKMNILINQWILRFGSPGYHLTIKNPQFARKSSGFVCKYFPSICKSPVDSKNLMSVAYHPHSNGHVSRFRQTIVTNLPHYVSEHQRGQDLYVQPLFYEYITQLHGYRKTLLYRLILSCYPPRRLLRHVISSTMGTPPNPNPQQMLLQFRALLATLQNKVDTHMRKSQARYMAHYVPWVHETPQLQAATYVSVDKPHFGNDLDIDRGHLGKQCIQKRKNSQCAQNGFHGLWNANNDHQTESGCN